jgi:subtilisin family serine protease
MRAQTILAFIPITYLLSLLPEVSGAPNELLIKWKNGPESAEAAAGNAAIGSVVKRTFSAIGWQSVRLREGMSANEGLAKYRALGDVAAVEPNREIHFKPSDPVPGHAEPRVRATATNGPITPNDPRWSSQWNMRKIGMPAAWAVTTGSNVVVAVIDTGVDYTHEDLRDNMWRNPGETGPDGTGRDKSTNRIDDDQNGYIDDIHGIDTADNDGDPMDGGQIAPGETDVFYHGSACAGIVAASGNNGRGVAGVAWGVKIMAIRFFRADVITKPWSAITADVLEAFNYILQQTRRGVNVRVTSNSWGLLSVKSPAIYDVIELVGVEGILFVSGTSNDALSSDLNWSTPDNYDLVSIISVAATDSSDRLANFSNYGPFTVDFAAPGDRVPTTKTNRTYYPEFSGVSAAIPHVAGAAALLFSAKPDATPLEVKAALMQSTDQLSSLRGKVATAGRLNVSRALEAITKRSLPAIVLGAFPASSHTEIDAEVEIWFNAPMNQKSVETSLVFNPAITGSLRWSEDSRVIRIKPGASLVRTNYAARLLGGATDQQGRTLDGDFDGLSEGVGADDFVWGFSFAPENDDFAAARRIQGLTGTITGTTVNTSVELDEPLARDTDPFGALSLWYQWQAPADGWITFDTSRASALETIVALYTGSSLETLSEVGYSDGWGSARRGRVSLFVRGGTNYFLTVAGRSFWGPATGYRGPFTLSWYPTQSPSLTANQFSPKRAIPGRTITLFGTNFTGATEVLFNGARAEFTPGLTNNADLRIVATVPPDAMDGPITIRTPHGDLTSSAHFEVLTPPLIVVLNAGDQPEISWSATSSLFLLENTDNLADSVWAAVDTGLITTNGSTVFRPVLHHLQRFFRLRKQSVGAEN